MTTLIYVDNPLKPTQRKTEYTLAKTLREWIDKKWPNGVNGTLTVIVDGYRIKDYGSLVFDDEMHVVVVRLPAFPPAIIAALQVALLQAAVGIVIGLVISAIFRPKKPTALVDQPSASPVYSISGSQNAARLGEPVPVGYGEFIQVPDFGSQPYTEFVGNEMYLNEILVIGQGDYEILEMFVGESSVDNITEGVIEYHIFGPDAHSQTMGLIEDGTGILENVVTSPEVGDQELSSGSPTTIHPDIYWRAVDDYINVSPNFTAKTQAELLADPSAAVGTTYSYSPGTVQTGGDPEDRTPLWYDVTATTFVPPPHPTGSVVPSGIVVTPAPGSTAVGWFECCKPTARGDRIMLDFIFPNGLYEASLSTGELGVKGVEIQIEYQRISSSGAALSAPTIVTHVFTGFTNTPQRFTIQYDDLTPSRYRVRVTRLTADATTNNVVDKIIWFGLKLKLVRTPVTTLIYGQATLVAVRIRATNGVASAATSRIRFRVRRLLPILGSGVPVSTRNPADAFVDIMTASYGAARPLTEVDIIALTACHTTWNAHSGFNGVFAQKSTVFEALSVALQVVAAGPLPVGQRMSVQTDSIKSTRVAMFNEANTNGLTIGYEFDKDGTPPGVRVEYRNSDSFTPAFVTYPEGELDVDTVTLFGCTDEDTATQYARLMWNRKTLQRKTVQFDTEMEGLILLPGERIAVQHQMAHWGQVGIVEEVTTVPIDLSGIAFVGQTSAVDTLWRAVAYGNGTYVAVGNGGTNGAMTSPDGITWTAKNMPISADWRGVAYGTPGGVPTFVAMAGVAFVTHAARSTNNGTTWVAASTQPHNFSTWGGVIWVESLGFFVAVALGDSGLGGAWAATSPTGDVWTDRTAPAGPWYDVAFGEGLLVAVGINGTVMTSPDGITWTSRTASALSSWWSVTYGNGIFVAVAEGGTRIMTSPDGITWTNRSAPITVSWRHVDFNGEIFAAIGDSSSAIVSSDGITWVAADTTSNPNLLWLGLTGESGDFVGVAGTGTGNRANKSTGTALSGEVSLVLDRKLDWTIQSPHYAYLSSEINEVSAALAATRGAEDHLLTVDDPGFEVFGKGEHQEQTRVSFGTMDLVVRDWIVLSAIPSGDVAVKVEAVVYNPDIYVGAMPHQLLEPGTAPTAGFGDWIIAGTPTVPAPVDEVLSGDLDDPSISFVLAGSPDDPGAEI